MTDNGSCYRSRLFTTALGDVAHKFTRPYRPQTNGKIERFHRTFARELSARHPGRVLLYAADEHDRRIGLAEHLGSGSTEVYVCGPAALMDAVSNLVPASRLHLERFVPVARVAASGVHPITVTCSRGGQQLAVTAQQSILEALEASGRAILGSCGKGVCGTCEVRVLDGTPEHLDSVMSDAEKNDLGVMYPCVSRATGSTLTLDI